MLKSLGSLIDKVRGGGKAAEPRVVVHALLDATSPNIMVGALHRVDAFTRAARASKGNLVVEADVFRGPFDIKPEKLSKLGHAIDHALDRFEPWQGHRLYHIDAKHQTVTHEDNDAKPSSSEYADNLAASMRQYPHAVHIVYVYGHGGGHHRMAHLSAEALGRDIEARCDRPIALAILDSCHEATAETLAALPSNIQAAVASQTPVMDMVAYRGLATVHDKQFDLERLLPALASSPSREGIDMGRIVLAHAASVPWAHGITLFNMQAFREALLPALSQLGQAITSGPSDTLRRADTARRAATSTYQAAALADLGEFLDRESTDSDSPTSAAAAKANEALAATRVHRVASDDLEHLSGISFQRVAQAWQDRADMKQGFGLDADTTTYADVRLPANWKSFIAALDQHLPR
jgi:hypothetical protein